MGVLGFWGFGVLGFWGFGYGYGYGYGYYVQNKKEGFMSRLLGIFKKG